MKKFSSLFVLISALTASSAAAQSTPGSLQGVWQTVEARYVLVNRFRIDYVHGTEKEAEGPCD